MSQSQQPNAIGVRIEVEGAVQGIGFRPWVYSLATASSLYGRVWNDAGSVTIEAFGDRDRIEAFIRSLGRPPMPAARIRQLRHQPIPYSSESTFHIVPSRLRGPRGPSIPPDLALCDDCRRELLDPADRRYRHPFVNCTRCGPRYTITLDSPYDRCRTTMRSFPLCEDCRREYEDPADRRYHAQPIACPTCGPKLVLRYMNGQPVLGEPIATAAALLRLGRIVAVKGLGGYHLACDARDGQAVAALRRRKRREHKPFAVMVADSAAAGRIGRLGAAEQALLEDPRRPVVLTELHSDSGLASEVAPGLPLVGLLLPYTPMHHLLLEAAAIPLVMTSGNRSDEPMVCDDADVTERLSGVAEVVLQHDRPIASRCDDSVARIIAGGPVVLRRGRGWTPEAIRVPRPFARAVLACGAHLKNTFCFAAEELAWLGPHVGDLETDEACRDFERMVDRFRRFVDIEPEVVVHDLHPAYFTSRWAERCGLPRLAVQHHHAHVASAMAEHGLDEPVLGFAWDGTGYGSDGTAWGGELLHADYRGFERLATFRPIPLAGGDVAIRQVWRIALALLDDAFDGEPPIERLELFRWRSRREIETVRRMIGAGLNAPASHGVGRYFDAVGALALACSDSHFEGEVAMRFGVAADGDEGLADAGSESMTPYTFALAPQGSSPLQIADLRPAVREIVADLLDRVSPAVVSRRFHATLAAVAAGMVREASTRLGERPVVLSGGCFQNPRLTQSVLAAVGPAVRAFTHHEVPPNDGGIALGQAMIAGAQLELGSGSPSRGDPERRM